MDKERILVAIWFGGALLVLLVGLPVALANMARSCNSQEEFREQLTSRMEDFGPILPMAVMLWPVVCLCVAIFVGAYLCREAIVRVAWFFFGKKEDT